MISLVAANVMDYLVDFWRMKQTCTVSSNLTALAVYFFVQLILFRENLEFTNLNS